MEAQLVFKILNMIQAGFSWLATRGIHEDRVQILLDSAKDGDLTTEQVQTELDATQSELDETAELINSLPDDTQ